MTFRKLIVPAILLAVGAAFVIFGRSESDRVAKVFPEVAAALSKTGSENPIAEMAKAKKVTEHLAPVIRVNAPELGMRNAGLTQEGVARAIVGACHGAAVIVSFENVSVRMLDAKRASATADVLCRGSVPGFGSGRDVRALHATLVKNGDGEWVFSDVTIVPVVEK